MSHCPWRYSENWSLLTLVLEHNTTEDCVRSELQRKRNTRDQFLGLKEREDTHLNGPNPKLG